jgi:hypothetical protein
MLREGSPPWPTKQRPPGTPSLESPLKTWSLNRCVPSYSALKCPKTKWSTNLWITFRRWKLSTRTSCGNWDNNWKNKRRWLSLRGSRMLGKYKCSRSWDLCSLLVLRTLRRRSSNEGWKLRFSPKASKARASLSLNPRSTSWPTWPKAGSSAKNWPSQIGPTCWKYLWAIKTHCLQWTSQSFRGVQSSRRCSQKESTLRHRPTSNREKIS